MIKSLKSLEIETQKKCSLHLYFLHLFFTFVGRQRLAHSGRYNLNSLKEIMLLLIDNAAPLSAEYLYHSLTGKWLSHRECHIDADFLLIYKIDDSGKDGRIVFVRTGTHTELFK